MFVRLLARQPVELALHHRCLSFLKHMLVNELETLRATEKEKCVTSFSQIPLLPKLIHMLLVLLFFLS